MRLVSVFLFLCVGACNPPGDSLVQEDADLVDDADQTQDADLEFDADIEQELDAEVEPEPSPTCEDLTAESDPVQVLACCLTERGAWLYHTYWCSYCYIQQRMFGEYFELLNEMDCYDYESATEIPECTERGIMFYPTWTFVVYDELTGEPTGSFILVEGLQHYEQLAEYSGCHWE